MVVWNIAYIFASLNDSKNNNTQKKHTMIQNKKRAVKRYFDSMMTASKFQGTLYNKYNSVQLITFPRFSEKGIYVWYIG